MVSGIGSEDDVDTDEVAEIRTRSDELERWLGELERGGGDRLSRLSETERRIVVLVRAGHTDDEIAQALFLSATRVEWSLTKIVRKLRADTAGGQSEVTATGPSTPNRHKTNEEGT
jgi:DNA-binding CsgD family transcriptional regulator